MRSAPAQYVTIRAIMNRRRRWTWLALFTALGIFIGDYVRDGAFSPFTCAVGLVLFIGAIFYSREANRCPACKASVGEIFKYGLPSKARFCPFCGVMLDTEFEKTDAEPDIR